MSLLAPFKTTLETTPRALGPWLLEFAQLLEAGAQLKYGFFAQRPVSPEARAALSSEFLTLAQEAFERAVRVSPRGVVAWLDSLNDLQKPAGIDFDSWRARASQLPEVQRSLPEPPAPLVEAVASLRRREGIVAAPPVSDSELFQSLDTCGNTIAGELISFFRLTGGLKGALSEETSLATPQRRASGALETSFSLMHRGLRAEYKVLPDGSVVQTREADVVKAEPLVVASSLTAFLVLLSGSPGPWVPAPGLALSGASRRALTAAEMHANRERRRLERERAAGLQSLDAPDHELATVARAFERLEAWAAGHSAGLSGAFAGPARAADLERVEARLAQRLPADLAALYALHDGENRPFFARFTLLTIEQALSEHRAFDGSWFPVVIHGSASTYDAVSLDPATYGQVVSVEKGVVRKVIARDLGAYFTRFALALERGWATGARGKPVRLHECFWSAWD